MCEVDRIGDVWSDDVRVSSRVLSITRRLSKVIIKRTDIVDIYARDAIHTTKEVTLGRANSMILGLWVEMAEMGLRLRRSGSRGGRGRIQGWRCAVEETHYPLVAVQR